MISSKRTKYSSIFLEIVMILLSFIVLIPVAMMLLGSFKTAAEAQKFDLSLPSKWEFSNYIFVFKSGGIFRAMTNSIVITFFGVILCIGCSSLCAFVISRRKSKFSKKVFIFFQLGLIAPLQLITTFLLLKMLNILGTYFSVIILYTAINLPFSVFLFSGFISTIPKELDEAAIVDGCGPLRMFFKIIFPLLKPVVATNLAMTAMSIWNDFTIPLYFFSSSQKWTMPLTVYNFFGQYFNNWNYVFADLVLTALPIMILYIFAQKYIIEGSTAGGVKG